MTLLLHYYSCCVSAYHRLCHTYTNLRIRADVVPSPESVGLPQATNYSYIYAEWREKASDELERWLPYHCNVWKGTSLMA